MASSDSESWDWEMVQIERDGAERYAQALQKLGLELSKALPRRVRNGAITALGTDPTCDLLVGNFRCCIKERALKLDSILYFMRI